MATPDHGDEEGGADAAAPPNRLILTAEVRVENGPLRLDNPASRVGTEVTDPDARLDASRQAIGSDASTAQTEDMASSTDPAAEADEMSRETLSRIIREEVDAALEIQIERRVRTMVRREVARSLSARRRG